MKNRVSSTTSSVARYTALANEQRKLLKQMPLDSRIPAATGMNNQIVKDQMRKSLARIRQSGFRSV